MNVEEAESVLVRAISWGDHFETILHREDNKRALNVALLALDKQKPKQAVKIKKRQFTCPVCGLVNNSPQGTRYCKYCGQAIDWSKENV